MVGRGRIGGLGIVGLMLKAVLGVVMFVLWELRGVEMIQTLLEIGEGRERVEGESGGSGGWRWRVEWRGRVRF